MRFISWNVNGLRACLKKGFEESMRALDADFICIQETKMQPGQAEVDLPDYVEFYCSAEKKGYSGTAIFARKEPLSVTYNFESHTDEGRGKDKDRGVKLLELFDAAGQHQQHGRERDRLEIKKLDEPPGLAEEVNVEE